MKNIAKSSVQPAVIGCSVLCRWSCPQRQELQADSNTAACDAASSGPWQQMWFWWIDVNAAIGDVAEDGFTVNG